MRTEEEIAEEIARLLDVKDRVIIFDIYGNHYHNAIDAQVVVLREKLNLVAIRGRYQDGYVFSQAVNARLWMLLQSDGRMSDAWESIADQATRKMSA